MPNIIRERLKMREEQGGDARVFFKMLFLEEETNSKQKQIYKIKFHCYFQVF